MYLIYDRVENRNTLETQTQGACSPRGRWPRWGPSGRTHLAGSGSCTAAGTTPAASALQRSETETDGQGDRRTDERERDQKTARRIGEN